MCGQLTHEFGILEVSLLTPAAYKRLQQPGRISLGFLPAAHPEKQICQPLSQEGVAIDFMKAHLRSMLTEIDKAWQIMAGHILN